MVRRELVIIIPAFNEESTIQSVISSVLEFGHVLIIDDVLSSGLAITEACDYLAPFDVDIAGALVALNRQEKGQDSDQMAADELREKGTEIFQIISLDDLINAESLIDKTNLIKMQEYREIYQGA